jgi:hypothetical protein
LAWLLGLTMTMTVWILLFGLLYGGNLLSRIMSMHCIQVVRGRRIEHYRKSKYKKAKPIDFCACDTNSVIGSLCILVPRTNSCLIQHQGSIQTRYIYLSLRQRMKIQIAFRRRARVVDLVNLLFFCSLIERASAKGSQRKAV